MRRARSMADAGIDTAMMDVIGHDDTISDVYHLDRPVDDFEATLAALCATDMEIVPHIVIGLHYGRILGEANALDIVARHGVHALVLVVVMPFYTREGMFQTPDTSDGAAVAAVTANYVVDLRAEGEEKASLSFLTTQMIARVAKRHRGIEDQETLNVWIDMMQLNDVPELLKRLATIIDVMVGDASMPVLDTGALFSADRRRSAVGDFAAASSDRRREPARAGSAARPA